MSFEDLAPEFSEFSSGFGAGVTGISNNTSPGAFGGQAFNSPTGVSGTSVNYQIAGANLSSGIGDTVISQPGAQSAPSSVAANPTAQAPVNQAAANAAQPAVTAGSIGDYFARAIIVVLGFIFIAMGLNMLKPGVVPFVPKWLKT
jgi:hypothetical protein